MDVQVFRDAHMVCCIRTTVLKNHTEFLLNDGRQIDLHRMRTTEFDHMWTPLAYSVKKAAEKFLTPLTSGILPTARARARLLNILSQEDQVSEPKTSPKDKLSKPAPKKVAEPAKAAPGTKATKAPFKADKPNSKKTAEPTAEKAPRGRQHTSKTIKLLAAENPKRKGTESYTRFELYRTCKTTADFLAKGGCTADLRYDAERGFISLGE